MDLLDKRVINQIISDIESSQTRERRQEDIKAFEIYSGMLSGYVEDRLKQIHPQTWRSFSVADLNICKKITDKRATAYKQAPIRKLDNDVETDAYESILDEMRADSAWKVFDTYYNLHRYACMWFNFVNKGDTQKLILRPLNPSQFFRVVDNVGETKVFVVNFPEKSLYEVYEGDGLESLIQDTHQDSGNKYKRYAIWTNKQHVVVQVSFENEGAINIKYEQIPGNEEMVNQLGVIPAVFKQQGDNMSLPILNPLPNQTIEFNQQYSVMLTGAAVQTFGHLILSYPEDQTAPDQIYNSYFTYSKLPQREGAPPTTLDYLNPSPNLGSQLDVISDYGSQILSEHLGDGASTLKGDSQQFASGIDRMIAMADITNIVNSNKEIYAEAEDDLYQIIKAYYAASNSFTFRSDRLQVKYPKPKPIQSESEILEVIQKKVDLGLITKRQALLELEPNMTSEQAEAYLEEIQSEKLNNAQVFLGGISADTEEQD